MLCVSIHTSSDTVVAKREEEVEMEMGVKVAGVRKWPEGKRKWRRTNGRPAIAHPPTHSFVGPASLGPLGPQFPLTVCRVNFLSL